MNARSEKPLLKDSELALNSDGEQHEESPLARADGDEAPEEGQPKAGAASKKYVPL
jgi:hypothetical protein